MSEKKSRRSSLWALNLSNPTDPLLVALEREAHLNEARYIRGLDGSIQKMRVIHDLAVYALKVLCTQRNDAEGLRLISEHEARERTREALNTGAPLPQIVSQQPIPTLQQTPQSNPPTATPTPLTPIPMPPTLIPQTQTPQIPTPPTTGLKKIRREGIFSVSSSGHMKQES